MSLELVRQYHAALPETIRSYLRNRRGISNAVFNLAQLGWELSIGGGK